MIPIMFADIIDDSQDLIRFEKIYHEYRSKMLYRAKCILGDSYEAEDAVHDAFIGIARNIKTVCSITDQRDLFYYLMRSAENAANSHMRKVKRYRVHIPLELTQDIPDDCFWETLSTKLAYEELVNIISALPEKYREVLYYHFVLELTIKEVASSLGIKLSTAKQRLVRGKQQLIMAIEKEGRFHYGID